MVGVGVAVIGVIVVSGVTVSLSGAIFVIAFNFESVKCLNRLHVPL